PAHATVATGVCSVAESGSYGGALAHRFSYMKESANPFLRDFQRKRPRMSGLAGSLPFIRSNLCTRHILNKITPRGHEDWPDKRPREEQCWLTRRRQGPRGREPELGDLGSGLHTTLP